MIDHHAIHADLTAYCAQAGIKLTTFGQLVVGGHGFADSLSRGLAQIGTVEMAQRFMADHPAVPRRQFRHVAKIWRDRMAAERAEFRPGRDGRSKDVGAITNGKLEYRSIDHNQESYCGVLAHRTEGADR